MEKTHIYNTLEAQHGEPSKRCQGSLPPLELALAVSKERGLILVAPHLRSIFHSRVSRGQKPEGCFGESSGSGKILGILDTWKAGGGGIKLGRAIMPRS